MDPDTLSARAPLPRPVVALGWVSFAQDVASEMVAPLLPLLVLGPLGATAAVVGLIEGLAEAASQALRPWSGRWADTRGHHRELTIGGYALSNLARPLLGLATGWGQVLALRTVDRLGKGVRTAPRDALLAHATPESQRGEAFGYHRSMDHLGAALGPLLAIGLLMSGMDLATVVLTSALPGALTVFLIWRTPLPQVAPAPLGPPTSLDARGRRLVTAAAFLSFANLPEAFMVVWAYQAGWGPIEIAGAWVAAHVLKTGVAWPAGILADRSSRERVVRIGWYGRAVVLAIATLIGTMPSTASMLALFLAYAAMLAVSEGAERALIAQASPVGRRGTAFGWYAALPGLAAVPGATLAGALWDAAGAPVAFALAAVLATFAAAMLSTLPSADPRPSTGA